MVGLFFFLNEVMYYERDSGTMETSTERMVGAGIGFFLQVWVLYLMHLFYLFLFATGLFGFQNSPLFFHAILRLSFPTFFPMSLEYYGAVC